MKLIREGYCLESFPAQYEGWVFKDDNDEEIVFSGYGYQLTEFLDKYNIPYPKYFRPQTKEQFDKIHN